MQKVINTHIPGLDAYPPWAWLACLGAATPATGYFLCGGDLFRALVGALATCVVVCLALTLRKDWKSPLYWLVIGACVATHAFLTMSALVRWKSASAALFTAFMILDLIAWQWLFAVAGAALNRRARNKVSSAG